MKHLLSLFALVFALSACAGGSAVDHDLWYDQWGYAHLTNEAENRIKTRGIDKLKRYGLTKVEQRGAVRLSKAAFFRFEDGDCILDFYYREPKDQLSLLVPEGSEVVEGAGITPVRDREELKRLAKQKNCVLPAS